MEITDKFINIGEEVKEESKKSNWNEVFFSSKHFTNNYLDIFAIQFPDKQIQVQMGCISTPDDKKEPVIEVYAKDNNEQRDYLGSFFPDGHFHFVKSKFKKYNVFENNVDIEAFYHDNNGMPKIGMTKIYGGKKYIVTGIEDPKPSDGVDFKDSQLPNIIVKQLGVK